MDDHSKSIVLSSGQYSIESRDSSTFGKVIKRSTLCSICLRDDCQEINMMRARDLMSYEEIIRAKNVTQEALDIHFRKHYHIAGHNQRMLRIKEDVSPEANELVQKIFDKELDMFSGIQSVLESKAERLLPIRDRMRHLTDRQEIHALEVEEISEMIELNKIAEKIENSIVSTYQVLDKKLFPVKKEELANAVLSYKLEVLSKILDRFKVVLAKYEQIPEYAELIKHLRQTLAEEFNQVEDEIVRSGGIMSSRT